MKCYYEVLGVARDVNDDDLKKAYKKLALKWHPDKNVDNEEVAKENFQLVQQAYEVLIDPHERAWYDNHREAILKGGLGSDYKDDSLDILPFFTASCYKGFGDDPSGFYAVYEEVFKKLAAEDSEYLKEDDAEIPVFGKSDSPYEEVVAPFYSYWMYYSTKKSYYWLDPHDTRQAPNHKIAKLIEKENKKVRDKAKKERNEEVRNLVAFVRKRDKRVQAWTKLLEDKARENQRKSEESRLQKMQERRNQMKDYKESDWLKFSNVENDLKLMEKNLAKEFGDDSESDLEPETTEDAANLDSFFCVACNKVFKTEKSFANHENSKKHKENVAQLKEAIVEENKNLNLTATENSSELLSNTLRNDNGDASNASDFDREKKSKKKSKQKKGPKIMSLMEDSDSDCSSEALDQLLSYQSKKSRYKNVETDDDSRNDGTSEKKIKKRGKKQNKIQNNSTDCDGLVRGVSSLVIGDGNPPVESDSTPSKPLKKNKKANGNNANQSKEINVEMVCAVCKNEFPSKNKLFNHLKSTGHSVYLPNSATALKAKEKEIGRKKKKEIVQ